MACSTFMSVVVQRRTSSCDVAELRSDKLPGQGSATGRYRGATDLSPWPGYPTATCAGRLPPTAPEIHSVTQQLHIGPTCYGSHAHSGLLSASDSVMPWIATTVLTHRISNLFAPLSLHFSASCSIQPSFVVTGLRSTVY